METQPIPSLQAPKTRTDEAARLVAGTYNQSTEERHFINEIRFSFYNHAPILEAIESGRAVDLVKLPKQPDKCALIIGSGPTLNPVLPSLKYWKGDIICSTSQATTLIYHGREPEHIVALDPDSNPEELAADIWKGRQSVLHIHPGVNPDLVRFWKGPISLFRKLQPQTHFYAQEQNIGYGTLGVDEGLRYDGSKGEPLIKGQIPMLAHVVPAEICIGKHLGYRQMYLVGCDLSYPGKIDRFTMWRYENDAWKEYPPEPLGQRETDPVVETEYDGLLSTPMMIFYSHQVVIAWRLTETNIVNTSQEGLLRVFPYKAFDEVLHRQNKGVKAFNLKQIRKVSEEYLARQNIYFLIIGNGVMPHEFKDPLHEIPRMIAQIKETLEKQGKGDQLDVEANMQRIKRLFKKVAER